MDEIAHVSQPLSKKIGSLQTTKPSVSIESSSYPEAVKESEMAKEIRNIEVKMEKTEHAFALVTEIREKIEAAYKQLSAKEE